MGCQNFFLPSFIEIIHVLSWKFPKAWFVWMHRLSLFGKHSLQMNRWSSSKSLKKNLELFHLEKSLEMILRLRSQYTLSWAIHSPHLHLHAYMYTIEYYEKTIRSNLFCKESRKNLLFSHVLKTSPENVCLILNHS